MNEQDEEPLADWLFYRRRTPHRPRRHRTTHTTHSNTTNTQEDKK